MRLKIIIDMDNSAFSDQAGEELYRILGNLSRDIRGSDRFHLCGLNKPIMDFNGNKIGKVVIT